MTAEVEGHFFVPRACLSKENPVVTKKEIVRSGWLSSRRRRSSKRRSMPSSRRWWRNAGSNCGILVYSRWKSGPLAKLAILEPGTRFTCPKSSVTFKPGKEMEERVRELERQAAAAAERSGAGNDPHQGDGTHQAEHRPVTETLGGPAYNAQSNPGWPGRRATCKSP